MSLPVALSLFAILIAVFALIAVGAVYSRVRRLEQTALNPAADSLADDARPAPQALWPGPDQGATVVLLLDGGCAICHEAWAAVNATELPQTRVVGVLGDANAADVFADGDVLSDPDLWTALYEGYAPSLHVIDALGTVTARRFVYGDTDIPELLTALLSMRSRHAL